MTNRAVLLATCTALLTSALAQTATGELERPKRERFLQTARIVSSEPIGQGVTGARRITLSDGQVTHDAQIQTVHHRLSPLTAPDGRMLDWMDSYKYNIAAHRLDKLLGLGLAPVSVYRRVQNRPAAVTWRMDDILKLERDRLLNEIEPTDIEAWNRQAAMAGPIDQLICNGDRNLGNTIVAAGWRMVLIDHSRAFPRLTTIPEPYRLTRCTRSILDALRGLDHDGLVRETGGFLTGEEIDALLARRDLIVEYFEKEIDERGAEAV